MEFSLDQRLWLPVPQTPLKALPRALATTSLEGKAGGLRLHSGLVPHTHPDLRKLSEESETGRIPIL